MAVRRRNKPNHRPKKDKGAKQFATDAQILELRDYRMALKLSQKYVAKMLGVTAPTYSNYEYGKKPMLLYRYVDALTVLKQHDEATRQPDSMKGGD